MKIIKKKTLGKTDQLKSDMSNRQPNNKSSLTKSDPIDENEAQKSRNQTC